jgi:preprotein translocase subunit Sec61beta
MAEPARRRKISPWLLVVLVFAVIIVWYLVTFFYPAKTA